MTRRSVSGIHLFRGKEPIAFESTLERDLLYHLEAYPTVLEVISQPVTLCYVDGGRERVYTPDYLVHYRQYGSLPEYGRYLPSELIEVKPKEELRRNLKKWKPRFRAAIRYCRERGYIFRLMHEDRIRDSMWANMRFLEPYRKMAIDPQLKEFIYEMARNMDCPTFDQLLNACCPEKYGRFGKAHGIAVIWHLLATGLLDCDLLEPLGRQTVLWAPVDVQ